MTEKASSEGVSTQEAAEQFRDELAECGLEYDKDTGYFPVDRNDLSLLAFYADNEEAAKNVEAVLQRHGYLYDGDVASGQPDKPSTYFRSAKPIKTANNCVMFRVAIRPEHFLK